MHIEHRRMRLDTRRFAPNASPAISRAHKPPSSIRSAGRRARDARTRDRSPRPPSAAPPTPGCRACVPPSRARALEALRMRDAAARRHPVHLAGPDRLLGADAVAMHDLAVEQIGDGRQPDVRMRPHVDRARNARREIDRTHVIEEDERPDHAPLRERQHASDLEAAEVAAPLFDDELDHGKSTPSCRRFASCCAGRATREYRRGGARDEDHGPHRPAAGRARALSREEATGWRRNAGDVLENAQVHGTLRRGDQGLRRRIRDVRARARMVAAGARRAQCGRARR